MDNLALSLEPGIDSENDEAEQLELTVVPNQTQIHDRDSLSEIFNSELEAWARHAMASNGFGDY